MKLYTLAETTSRRTDNNAQKLTTHDAGHDYSPVLKRLAVCHV